MPERIFGTRTEPHLVDQLSIDQLLNGGIDPKAHQQIRAEARSDDGSRGKRAFCRGASRVMRAAIVTCRVAGTQHLGRFTHANAASSLAHQDTTFGELTGDLLARERITGRAAGNDLADLTRTDG